MKSVNILIWKHFKYLTEKYNDIVAWKHLWRGIAAENVESPKVVVLALADLKPSMKTVSESWRLTLFFIHLPKNDLPADEKYKKTCMK